MGATSIRPRERWPEDGLRVRLLASGWVGIVPGRCIECGTCVHNCPMGIDVRAWAREQRPVTDRRCILCGSCVVSCPRDGLELILGEGA